MALGKVNVPGAIGLDCFTEEEIAEIAEKAAEQVIPGSGTAGQVLTRTEDGTEWQDVPTDGGDMSTTVYDPNGHAQDIFLYVDDAVNETVAAINAEKMSNQDPVGEGSFSLNRKADTKVGTYSFAEGQETTASGQSSHAEGVGTEASGVFAHAEGQETTASGQGSHAEGYGTTSYGGFSHAEGCNTAASGIAAHAEGYGTKAAGQGAHAEGYNTNASVAYSHAEGAETTASGQISHAEGYYTTAQRKSQHVQGEYNVLDASGTATTRGKYAHIVGNGTSDNARSNAHTLDWSGNAWFAGDVYVGSTSGTNRDDGSMRLVKSSNIVQQTLVAEESTPEVEGAINWVYG